MLGIGHAYHQEFSILSELMAADEYLENSKICVVLSPGWFETNGTNSAAFVEFVRPNFLKSIIYNNSIPNKYKAHLGEYIYNNKHEIDGVSNEMEILEDYFLFEEGFIFQKIKSKIRLFLKKMYSKKEIGYDIGLKASLLVGNKVDYESSANQLQKEFVSKITTNDIYVYDEYYSQYLIDDNGKEKKGSINQIELTENKELADFFLLVEYLKLKNVNASFIIQPYNPYYFSQLENLNPILDVVKATLDKNEIPYLNMFVDNKADYEPGTLKDVMHLGDYGWLKVNYFLDSLYNEQ